jgi:xanthine dehydrogenase YagR molybdenum-binding subunit
VSDPIGAPLDRVDGTAKVTGTARYAADTVVAGVAHGVLVDAAIARGRITRIDATAAEAAPGVVAVLTHHNTPRLTAPTMPGRGQSHLPLQDDVIHHRGQHVAMIVAHTLEQAQHAAAVLKVEYHAERPEVSLVGKLTEAFGWPGGVDVTWGDPAAALAVAPVHVRAELTTPTQHHHPMEPWATIAAWKGDELTLYESTQGVSLTQEVVAATLGIPRRDVRVVAPFLGGGL